MGHAIPAERWAAISLMQSLIGTNGRPDWHEVVARLPELRGAEGYNGLVLWENTAIPSLRTLKRWWADRERISKLFKPPPPPKPLASDYELMEIRRWAGTAGTAIRTRALECLTDEVWNAVPEKDRPRYLKTLSDLVLDVHRAAEGVPLSSDTNVQINIHGAKPEQLRGELDEVRLFLDQREVIDVDGEE